MSRGVLIKLYDPTRFTASFKLTKRYLWISDNSPTKMANSFAFLSAYNAHRCSNFNQNALGVYYYYILEKKKKRLWKRIYGFYLFIIVTFDRLSCINLSKVNSPFLLPSLIILFHIFLAIIWQVFIISKSISYII